MVVESELVQNFPLIHPWCSSQLSEWKTDNFNSVFTALTLNLYAVLYVIAYLQVFSLWITPAKGLCGACVLRCGEYNWSIFPCWRVYVFLRSAWLWWQSGAGWAINATNHTKISQGLLTPPQIMTLCGERGIRDFWVSHSSKGQVWWCVMVWGVQRFGCAKTL